MFVTVLVIGDKKQFFVTLTLTNNYQHKSLIIGVELKNSTVEAHHSLSFYKINQLIRNIIIKRKSVCESSQE